MKTFIAVLAASAMTGRGVYQSCTKYNDMRREALALDAIGAVLMAGIAALIMSMS